ncbi:MAG: RlmE family RNA methyltransferase [Alphaproteobacteria bacterium]
MTVKSGDGGGRRRGSGHRGLTVRVKTARKRSNSSFRWLERQLNDPYVAEAQRHGYRSRAAFKLIELDDKYRFLRPGQRVVDLGAAPGGWTQVAVARVKSREGKGKVVALDLLEIPPIVGAHMIVGDFTTSGMEKAIMDALGGPADVVLSDMSPSTTGHRGTDHLRIMGLVEVAAAFAIDVLVPGGTFVAKVFEGGAQKSVLDELKRRFASVRHVKPPASRKDSAEMYLVATGFKKS